MKKLFILFFSLALCASQISAQPEDMAKSKMKMANYLELTAEQESKISDLKLQLKKEIMPLESEIGQFRSNINLELTSDNFSESKIKKLTEDIARLQKEIHFKRIMHQKAIRDMLTAEQKKKFDLHLLSQREPRGVEGPGFQHRSHQFPSKTLDRDY
jgi:Spy/CpxP family protein refolding chaperone